MRILFILPEFFPVTTGGISTYYQNLLPALVAEGCEITVIHGSATFNNVNTHFKHKGVDVFELKTELFRKYQTAFNKFSLYPEIKNHLAAAWAMYEQAQDLEDFDFVETTDFGWGFVPWVINNLNKLVVTFHASTGEITEFDPSPGKNLEEDITRILELTVLKHASNLNTYSTQSQKAWQKRLGKPIQVIPPAFEENDAEARNTSHSTESYALVVGRLQYWKGATTLTKALSLIDSNTQKAIWLGRDMRFSNTMMSAHLSSTYPSVWNIKLENIPQANKTETIKRQQDAAYVIVPSIWDVFNFTCIEAMSLGKVVICSSGAGASDLIVDGENGFIFQKDNSEDLAKVILKVESLSLADKSKIGWAAKRSIQKNLLPTIVARKRLEWYKQTNLSSGKVEDWVAKWLSPDSHSGDSFEATLESVPLKKLLLYSIKRIKNKIGR